MTNPRWRPIVLLAAVLCALCAASCRPGGGAASAQFKDYNVIMVSMNNVGADHMSLYGYKRKTTPKIDALADRSVVFEQVTTPTSWTLPAATSVFTSLQPYSHRVMDRWQGNMLNAEIPVLGEVFASHGYTTGTFTGGLDYRPTFGHLRGIAPANSSFNLDFTQFDTSLAQATRWLSYNQDKKFFLVVQGYDAHPPFHPDHFRGTFSKAGPNVNVCSRFALRGYKNGDKYEASYIWEETDERKRAALDIMYPPEKRTITLTQADMDYLRDLYDESIMSVDERVDAFLSKIDPKVLEHTIVVLFSEHGEMFGKHGRFGRAGTVRGTLYEDVVHVPVIVRLPSGKKARVAGLVQLIDIAPTLLDLVGIDSPPGFQGKSLVGMMDGGPPVNEYAFAGALYNVGTKRGHRSQFFADSSANESIRDDRWKLIHEVIYPGAQVTEEGAQPTSESYELYDIKADPDEQHNVADANPAVVEKLKTALNAWRTSSQAIDRDKPSTTVNFGADFEEKARAGGYWQ